MKIATFNVNGVNGRLPVLLRWLEEAKPDAVCLQELKAPQDRFPEAAIKDAGYGAIWHGQKSWNGVAILARGGEPHKTRQGLPGDPDDTHSRYIEAAVKGVLIGCLYLPNENPAPGPKFDYKLAWFKRLIEHAAGLFALDAPVVLAGDYNVMPTDLDVYKPERWIDDARFRPEVRSAFQSCLARAGRMPCASSIRTRGSIRSGTTFGTPTAATRDFALTTSCCLPRPRNAWWPAALIAIAGVGKKRVTTLQLGLNWPMTHRPDLTENLGRRKKGA